MRNTADVTGGKPIAVLLQSISGGSAINPLVAFYDIHGGKREVLFFYFIPDTTRDIVTIFQNNEVIIIFQNLRKTGASLVDLKTQTVLFIQCVRHRV
jgi:hypothetical protein